METLSNSDLREPLITDIQSYSLQDGPGIRTTIFLKGCPLRCPWCHNPETQKTEYEVYYNPAECIGCARCAEVCPTGSTYIEKTGEGEFIRMDRDKCTGCAKCVEVCPAGAREKVGRKISIEKIIKEATSDELFFIKSGGGVTISGGEPMLFPDFTFELARILKKINVHTAIETSATCQWKHLERMIGYMDLFLVDIKTMDEEKYRNVIKGDLKLVLSNIENLLQAGARVRIRLPIIPGFNDDPKSYAAYADYLGTLVNRIESVDILPFHAYAEKKYTKLGRAESYPYLNMDSMPEKDTIPLIKLLIQAGFIYGESITVGGLIGVRSIAQRGEAQ